LEKEKLIRLVEIAEKHDIDGYVLTNTSKTRQNLKTTKNQLKKIGNGGLSGAALTEMANQQLKTVYDLVGKKKILIGVGGLMSFEDLLAKLSCGASLFQIYTGLIYHGPFFVRDLNKKLAAYCREHGVKNYRELIGETLL
jgi:dihydroorotate dehydrogenase